jgi:hypothetical protein
METQFQPTFARSFPACQLCFLPTAAPVPSASAECARTSALPFITARHFLETICYGNHFTKWLKPWPNRASARLENKRTMKGTMRSIAKILGALIAAVTLVVMSGCATSDKPHYQGHKGVSPTVNDYYPTPGSGPNR